MAKGLAVYLGTDLATGKIKYEIVDGTHRHLCYPIIEGKDLENVGEYKLVVDLLPPWVHPKTIAAICKL